MNTKHTTHKNTTAKNVAVVTVFLLFIASFLLVVLFFYQSSVQAKTDVMKKDVKLVLSVLEDRLKTHEYFIEMIPSLLAEPFRFEHLAQNYIQEHPEIVAVVWKNDSLKISKVISKTHQIVSGSYQYDPMFFRKEQSPSLLYSPAWRTEKEKLFGIEKAVFNEEKFVGIVILVVSPEELLKAVLEHYGVQGYDGVLLSPSGERLVTTGFPSSATALRESGTCTVALGTFSIELSVAEYNFWEGTHAFIIIAGSLLALVLLVLLFQILGSMKLLRATQHSLRESEERFRIIFENSADGMRLTDRHGRIVMVNTAYCDLIKVPHQKLLDTYNTSSGDEADTVYTQQFDAGTLKMPTSQVLKRATGEEVPVEISNTFLTIGDTQKYMLSIFRDVTERKRMEMDSLQVQKMDALGTFAVGIGNNFNNLVGMILNAAELLQKKIPPSPQTEEYFNIILSSAKRGSELAADLLVFARSDNKNFYQVSIAKSFDHVKKILEHSLPPSIKLHVESNDTTALVLGDLHQLHQAIVNLAFTAYDRMPEGGTLTITASVANPNIVKQKVPLGEKKEYIAISIADTGVPMSEQEKRRIFEPYFSTKMVNKESGLRLSVVYAIVKNHRGFIDIYSTQTAGTIFSMYFPVEQHETITAEPTAPAASIKGGTEWILIVDDEEAFRQLYAHELKSYGYNVLLASDGVEALKKYEEKAKDIALVVTDLSMPNINGEELFQRLIKLNPRVKVIFATGNIDHKSRNELLAMGVKEIIDKPFSLDELMVVVRRVMDAK